MLVVLLVLSGLAGIDGTSPVRTSHCTLRTSAGPALHIAARPKGTDPLVYQTILPEHHERIDVATGGSLPWYRESPKIAPFGLDRATTVSGTIQRRNVNDTAASQSRINLRLYPTVPAYNGVEMIVFDISAAGLRIVPIRSIDDTVVRIDLPAELSLREAMDLELSFAAMIPGQPRERLR